MSGRKPKEPFSSKDRTHIEIDYSLIPEYKKEELAAAVLKSVKEYIRQPGGREKLDALKEAREVREAAKRAAK